MHQLCGTCVKLLEGIWAAHVQSQLLSWSECITTATTAREPPRKVFIKRRLIIWWNSMVWFILVLLSSMPMPYNTLSSCRSAMGYVQGFIAVQVVWIVVQCWPPPPYVWCDTAVRLFSRLIRTLTQCMCRNFIDCVLVPTSSVKELANNSSQRKNKIELIKPFSAAVMLALETSQFNRFPGKRNSGGATDLAAEIHTTKVM